MLELFGFICCMYLLYKYVEHDQETPPKRKVRKTK